MLLPIAWLEKYVEIPVSTREMADAITNSGSHVESIILPMREISGVVIGQIEKITNHPNAEKLVICDVNIGSKYKQIITGAKNIFEGAKVPVALDGATLADGTVIKDSELRGEMSQGMLCSLEEMGFSTSVIPRASRDGIHILPEDVPIGADFCELLNLNKEILELEITPNRPDCLSIIGMAIETSASLGSKLTLPEISYEAERENIEEVFSGVEVQTPKCSRFYTKVLTDVKLEPSPQWMQNQLMAAGIRPINNIVDITNYVMMEYGQPLHPYDLDTLAERKIVVREAGQGEVMKTLDGKERKMEEGDILICDGENIIGMAGIMGGLETEVSDSTKNILLEAAHFDSDQIRETSKRLNHRTEASNLFEKGVEPEKVKMAADRVCQLAVEIGAAKVLEGSVDVYREPADKIVLASDPEKINKLLGTDLSPEQMKKILDSLLLDTVISDEKLLSRIPSFRQDITIWQDIAEEVGRIYGFANIESKLPESTMSRGGRIPRRRLEERAKQILLGAGFNEFMSYSFISPKSYDRIGLPEDSPLRNSVKLINPLGEEYSIMRTTLMPNMLDIFAKNISYKNKSAYGFEFGNTFSTELGEEGLPQEEMKLALGFYGEEDFYFLKEVIFQIFDSFGLGTPKMKRLEGNGLFHDGRAAELYVRDAYMGCFGEVHPLIRRNLGLTERIYLGELEFKKMVRDFDDEILYEPIVKFPEIHRDIALVMAERQPVGDIVDAMKAVNAEILSSVDVFDVYAGNQVGAGKKSVALTLRFQSKERTLVEEEVTTIVEEILKKMEEEYGATLRTI